MEFTMENLGDEDENRIIFVRQVDEGTLILGTKLEGGYEYAAPLDRNETLALAAAIRGMAGVLEHP